MNEKIFVSYKSDEYSIAKSIAERVKRECTDYWMAPESIEGGKSYAQQIPQAIHNCSIVLLVLSKSAMESAWVARELDCAINEEKTILPFQIDDAPLTKEFKFYLSNVQCYRAGNQFNEELERMILDIKKYLGISVQNAEIKVESKDEIKDDFKVEKVERKESNTFDSQPQIKNSSLDNRKRWIVSGAIAAGILLCIFVVIFVHANGKNGKNSVETEGTNNQQIDKRVDADENVDLRFQKVGTSLTIQGETLSPNDIDQIGKCVDLTELYVEECDVRNTNLSSLSALKNLMVLSLAGSQISPGQMNDLPLENLKQLNVSDTGLSLDDLVTLNYVEVLYAERNGIIDLKPIENFLSLTKLSLDGNELKNLSPIGKLPNIKELSLNDCSLASLVGLEQCIWMQKLNAANNQIETLKGMENMTQLECVNLEGNAIQDVSILIKSKESLKELSLANNQLKRDYSFRELANLEYLNVSNNQLGAIRVSELEELRVLIVDHNEMYELSFPEKNLFYLSAADCDLYIRSSDEQVFANTEEKEVVVILEQNHIIDLDFSDSVSYRVLSIVGASVNFPEVYDKLGGLSGGTLYLDYDSSIDFEVLIEKWSEIYVADCPLDRVAIITKEVGDQKDKVHFVSMEEAIKHREENEDLTGVDPFFR